MLACKSISTGVVLGIVLLVTAPAWPQSPPDAGALQQQIERERELKLPKRVAPERPAIPAELAPSGITVTVREFRFAGNTLLTKEQLAKAVADYLNKPLDFAQLQAAAVAVANAYREAGWVVRAYLPQQDIQNGVVTIQIIEAVFGKLIPEGELKRIAPQIPLARFEALQKTGEPLNALALDRALLLADDLPGVTVAGALRPGAQQGQTDLALKLADEPLLIGEIAADITGSRSTGIERITASLNMASPMGFGDQLLTNLIYSEGTNYARVALNIPVGVYGLRMGANASWLEYKLITSEFKALDAKGDSSSYGLDANYPIIRSRLRNLFASIAHDQKEFDNRSSGSTNSDYRIQSTTFALFGNLFDSVGGGGANSASLAFTDGKLTLSDSDPRPRTSATPYGSFKKWRAALTRQQVITPELSLFTALSAQWANKNLDSSEKFYLGGSSGVRAYPSNEGGGSEGRLANIELRWRLPQGFNAAAFYDWGQIRQNVDNQTLAANPNRYSLKGYGLSLAWQPESGLNLKAAWARRNGRNPNADPATGNDQDGSLDKNRWWFTASLPF